MLFHTSAMYFKKSRTEKSCGFFSWGGSWVLFCFLILTLVNITEPADHMSLGCWMADGIFHFIGRGRKRKAHVQLLVDNKLLFQSFVFKHCVFSCLGKLCMLADVRLLYILSN